MKTTDQSAESPYVWTPEEVAAAFAAYNAAPDTATKEELRAIMEAARAEVKSTPPRNGMEWAVKPVREMKQQQ